MDNYIKCYNTLRNTYEEVCVTEEIAQFYRRSYWREDMQERRYYQRCSNVDDLLLDSTEVYAERNSLVDDIIREQEYSKLYDAIGKLNQRDRIIVYGVYFQQRTLTSVAHELGISIPYASRLLKKSLLALKTLL